MLGLMPTSVSQPVLCVEVRKETSEFIEMINKVNGKPGAESLHVIQLTPATKIGRHNGAMQCQGTIVFNGDNHGPVRLRQLYIVSLL